MERQAPMPAVGLLALRLIPQLGGGGLDLAVEQPATGRVTQDQRGVVLPGRVPGRLGEVDLDRGELPAAELLQLGVLRRVGDVHLDQERPHRPAQHDVWGDGAHAHLGIRRLVCEHHRAGDPRRQGSVEGHGLRQHDAARGRDDLLGQDVQRALPCAGAGLVDVVGEMVRDHPALPRDQRGAAGRAGAPAREA